MAQITAAQAAQKSNDATTYMVQAITAAQAAQKYLKG